MGKTRLVWDEADGHAKAAFSIAHIGKLSLEVETLPGAGQALTADERHALVLRHAKLLVRNFANELERQ